MANVEEINDDDLDSFSKLQSTKRYTDIIQKVEKALQNGSDASNHQGLDSEEEKLIDDCYALLVDIDNEIAIVDNFILERYCLRFPELQCLVCHPIDYAQVVKRIGNEMDLAPVDLEDLLPEAIRGTVSLKASTTTGKPLSSYDLNKTIGACDRALALDLDKSKVLDFCKSRVGYTAPNLAALVGSAVAAKLIGAAGGLKTLAAMRPWYFHLGLSRVDSSGSSTTPPRCSVGYLDQTDIFISAPDHLKQRARDLMTGAILYAALVDIAREDPEGRTGMTIKNDALEVIRDCFVDPTYDPLQDNRRVYGVSHIMRRGESYAIVLAPETRTERGRREGSRGEGSGVSSELYYIFTQPVVPGDIRSRNPHAYVNWLYSLGVHKPVPWERKN